MAVLSPLERGTEMGELDVYILVSVIDNIFTGYLIGLRRPGWAD